MSSEQAADTSGSSSSLRASAGEYVPAPSAPSRQNANRIKLQLARNRAAAGEVTAVPAPAPVAPVAPVPASAAITPLEPTFTCLLCCNDFVQYIAVGPCNHHICSLCMLRMRCKGGNDSNDKFNNKILNDKNCTICKQAIETCVVYKIGRTHSSSSDTAAIVRSYESFELSGFTGGNLPGCAYDEKSSMLFVDCKDHCAALEEKRAIICPHRSCSGAKKRARFPSNKALLAHLRDAHDSYVCTLCFDNRPLFISEHRLFSQKQLDKHLRSLPGAMTAAGGDKTGGHPLCTFCGSNFFDAYQLFVHMRSVHSNCVFCPPALQNRYYNRTEDLWTHFRFDHFVCEFCHPRDAPVHSSTLVATAVFCSRKEHNTHLADVHNKRGSQHHIHGQGGAVGVGFKYGNSNLASAAATGFIDLDMSSPDPTRSLIGSLHSQLNGNNSSGSSRQGGASSNASNMHALPGSGGGGNYRDSDHVMIRAQPSSNINIISPSLLDINPNFRVAGQVRSGRFARGVDDDIIQQAAELLQRERASMSSYSGALGGGSSGLRPGTQQQDFPSLAPAAAPAGAVTKELHPMSLVNRASQAKKDEDSKKQKAIEDDARRRERNSRLASALGVAPSVGGSVEGELQSLSRADVFIADSCITRFQTELRRHLFPLGLVSWARASQKTLQQLERRVFELLQDPSSSSAQLKPMDASARAYVHCLAKHHGLNSYEYDPEPRRYVSLVKTIDSCMPSMRLSQALALPPFHYSLAVSVSGANTVLGPTLRSAEQPLLYFIAKVHVSACKPTAAAGGAKVGSTSIPPAISTVAALIVRIQNVIAAVSAAGIGSDDDGGGEIGSAAALLPRIVGMKSAGACGVLFEFASLVEATKMYLFLLDDYRGISSGLASMVKETVLDYYYIEPGFVPPAPAAAGGATESSSSSSLGGEWGGEAAAEGNNNTNTNTNDDDDFIVPRSSSRFKTSMFKRSSSFSSSDGGSNAKPSSGATSVGGGGSSFHVLADSWEDAEEGVRESAGQEAVCATTDGVQQKGCWACDACTYENDRSAQRCGVCGNVNDWIEV